MMLGQPAASPPKPENERGYGAPKLEECRRLEAVLSSICTRT